MKSWAIKINIKHPMIAPLIIAIFIYKSWLLAGPGSTTISKRALPSWFVESLGALVATFISSCILLPVTKISLRKFSATNVVDIANATIAKNKKLCINLMCSLQNNFYHRKIPLADCPWEPSTYYRAGSFCRGPARMLRVLPHFHASSYHKSSRPSRSLTRATTSAIFHSLFAR